MNKPEQAFPSGKIVTGEVDPPPIADEAAWLEIVGQPLDAYRPEALVLALDARLEISKARNEGHARLDEISGPILAHLDVLARACLDRFFPWSMSDREAAIDDAAGIVIDGLIRRDRNIESLRTHFVGAVYSEYRHYFQHKARDGERQNALQERGPDVGWLARSGGIHRTSALDQLTKLAMLEFLAKIEDPRHRFAVRMHLVRYSRSDIARVVRVRDPETVTQWLVRYLGEENL